MSIIDARGERIAQAEESPRPLTCRTQAEVAEILAERGDPMSRQMIHFFEARALAKLREGLADLEFEI